LALENVVGALVLVADAFFLGMAVVPTRAGIHARHEHERGGIFGRILGSANGNHTVLQRLAHDLQHISRKLGQLIQAEEMVPLFAILWH